MLADKLQRGVRIIWNKPPNDDSGNKNGSVDLQNPLPGNLTYDGLDGQFQGYFSQKNNLTGLAMGAPMAYVWLNYKLGHTAVIQRPNMDVLSGMMSGCPIVTWTEGGVNYVAHVGTVEANDVQNKRTKEAFAAYMLRKNPNTGQDLMQNVRAFSPANAYTDDEFTSDLWARKVDTVDNTQASLSTGVLTLVTGVGNFYSVMVAGLKGIATAQDANPAINRYIVLGIKQCLPIGGDELFVKLTGMPKGMVMHRRGRRRF